MTKINSTHFAGNFTQIPNEIIDSELLNSDEKVLLLFLLRFNPSYPSYQKIQTKLQWSRPFVSKNLKSLEAKNILCIVRNGFKKNNSYSLKEGWLIRLTINGKRDLLINSKQELPLDSKQELPILVNDVNPNNTTNKINLNNITKANKTINNTKNVVEVIDKSFKKKEDDMNTNQTSSVEGEPSTDMPKSNQTPSTNNNLSDELRQKLEVIKEDYIINYDILDTKDETLDCIQRFELMYLENTLHIITKKEDFNKPRNLISGNGFYGARYITPEDTEILSA